MLSKILDSKVHHSLFTFYPINIPSTFLIPQISIKIHKLYSKVSENNSLFLLLLLINDGNNNNSLPSLLLNMRN